MMGIERGLVNRLSLGDERRSGSMNDLALALVFMLAVALLITAIYVAVTS
jgi:hypothetical protein